ncbi:MAG: electron transfer flavoprotein subunit beta/FixA family protein [Proteobacteria bacterium]|nr:electron transfer flavoprotein subunit beta/FixA family protein [Pseudomonadota bacterium]
MKIFVCVKQVPDTETKIKIGPDGASIDTATIKWVMNPYDEFAVEEAVKTKEANAGAQVFVVTAGPKKRAGEVLRTALAMGADEGIAIDTPEFIDPLVTAQALAAAIKAEGGADLIFTGKLAIDDNASSVGQMVAEILGVPHTSVVSKFSLSPEGVTVERDIEGGAKEIVKMQKPALVTANKGLNMPRYASLPGIMKAKKKILKELDLAQLGVSTQGKTKTLKIELPAEKPAVKMLTGDVSAQATQLVSSLRDEAKVL